MWDEGVVNVWDCVGERTWESVGSAGRSCEFYMASFRGLVGGGAKSGLDNLLPVDLLSCRPVLVVFGRRYGRACRSFSYIPLSARL